LALAPSGKLQKLGRFISRLLLDALSVFVYMLTTFVLFVLVYDKGQAGYGFVSKILIISYYFRVVILAAKVVLSPVSSSLRLLPLQDDDAFRVGDYVETAGTKGMVEHISLRSLRLRHPRGMVYTIPFGGLGSVTNSSRDYIITKLDIRIRYDTDIDKIRKIIKRINRELEEDDAIGPVLLSKIKSQGVREMDDSAMIVRVKFKTIPGEQFIVRREVYRRIQELFREHNIEFAHRNVTVYLPPDETGTNDAQKQEAGDQSGHTPDKRILEAGAAAAVAASQSDGSEKKPKE
jgi:small-conductance mechanosensitive channel